MRACKTPPRLYKPCRRAVVSRLFHSPSVEPTEGLHNPGRIAMNRHAVIALLGVVLAGACPLVQAGEERTPLFAPGVKLRVLVDKVMQPEADWKTEQWMVRAAADAGFNVFSPRRGHDDLEEVRRVAGWCRKYGIYYMPWMRGSLTAPSGPAADGRRMLWASGLEQPLWSPNADQFWQWTNRYIVEYARISAENDALVGVFLDYENYAPGRPANLYDLSYDDEILRRFAAAQGITIPQLAPAERKAWLAEHQLHEAFAIFQVEQWRKRCRQLRQAVDRFNPKFRFCVYPAPGTPFMVQAIYPEWSTNDAPLILADASTYGRPGRLLPEQEALERNRQRLLERMQVPRQAGIPFVYIGGIDPVVRGADPEFCGKNAVMISHVTDGYWIFYEGISYKGRHPEYWEWFTWANRAIAAGDFHLQHQQRKTPETWSLRLFDRPPRLPQVVPPSPPAVPQKLPPLRLRGENLLLLACRKGQPVEVTLGNVPVAHYKAMLAWEVRDAAQRVLASGIAPHDHTAQVRFTAPADGLYWLGASSGQCAWVVQQANVPVGLYGKSPLHVIRWTGTLYFHVPDRLDQFSVTASGSGTEMVKATLVDPEGKEAASGETSPDREEVKLAVSGDRVIAGRWQLILDRASQGTLEDYTVELEGKLPGILSPLPELLFLAAP